MDHFLHTYQVIVVGVTLFLIVLHVVIVWQASQGRDTLGNWVPMSIGLLFCFIGNFLNKTEPNFFLGIRTPWTLADPEVWARTHRYGGWAFMVFGAILFVGAIVLTPQLVLVVTLAGAGILVTGLFGYSYWLYAKLNRDSRGRS